MIVKSSFDYKISSEQKQAIKELYSVVAKAGITRQTNIVGIGKNGESLAEIAKIQNEGGDGHRATNFISGGFPDKQLKLTSGVMKSKESVRSAVMGFAKKWSDGIKQYITSQGHGTFDKLSERTILNRRLREKRGLKTRNIGGNDRLIDSGTMLNAISYKVEKN